ncbi:hypothetical protein MTO96_023454 [Rhipicephalus appendiculatus]
MITFPTVETTNEEMELSLLMSTGSIEQSTSEEDSWESARLFATALCLLGLVPGIVACAVLTVYFLSPEPEFSTTLEWLRQKLDFNVDPCEDFYRYVCGTYHWPRPNILIETARSMFSIMIGAAYAARVPATGQSAWQKAAGIFQACVALAKPGNSETKDLVKWMISIHLDLGNLAALKAFDPTDMMVRCSLDFGVHAIIAIISYDDFFEDNKRAISIAYSKADYHWQAGLRDIPKNESFLIYVDLLELYGLDPSDADSLATSISEIEEQHEWASAFAKHTNNTYSGDDKILYNELLLDVLVELFQSVDAGGIRSLIAWSVFRQLVARTEPRIFFAASAPTSACFVHVYRVMKLAFASRYLNFVTNEETVKTATTMVQNIREAFRTAFNTSSWVEGAVREVAIKKLSKMKYHVGSPGQRLLDPANIDNYYDTVPDVDPKRFFQAYRAARQASAHRSWSDQKTWIYDETLVNAYYIREMNTAVIPAGILQNPFFNVEGPAALNYGGIGVIIGHEIMHGYDVGGTMYDDESMRREWRTPEFLKKYTERTLCLRKSHKAAVAMKAREAVINDTVDSENLADLVGTALAHAAFAALPPVERNVRLPGLNLTAEHLFFIGNCAKWCEGQNMNSVRYAAGHFRCIVPLMNMAEFSAAFGCAPKTFMNPPKKCAFWS